MTPVANGPVTWAVVSAIGERVARLEEHVAALTESSGARRNRNWLIVLGILTGLVCPVIVTSIIAWLHLRA